ncbi:hypothetical protein [Singulisphaera acidiphila]|uniref:Uncharacterized protein n=1 Tax=Singulisphaera acidiphila (strain ATCC BAA-1392 / DSM 18658 / VKM B-2454 / MOB10) TaxID=886293 RepID=L0DHN4_SINAD|nr:hypothetical protein [Singulisphaera acidiphila]AGA28859.1 hypothetical protein Sinac_4682 [Singulisphaera acidiphila DSM 18658]
MKTRMFNRLLRTCGLMLVVAALSNVAWASRDLDAPEIDPGSIAGAMTLLSGGLMLLTDRCRRK